MFNLPVGVGKELDDTNVECEWCGGKVDVDDGEYVLKNQFCCNDCLKEYFVNTADGYILSENYDDWKTDKLRELVKELREHYQIYFSPDEDGSSFIERREILNDIEKLDEKVYDFVDNAYYFFIEKNGSTLEQLYHVIDYLCGTELEMK